MTEEDEGRRETDAAMNIPTREADVPDQSCILGVHFSLM